MALWRLCGREGWCALCIVACRFSVDNSTCLGKLREFEQHLGAYLEQNRCVGICNICGFEVLLCIPHFRLLVVMCALVSN